MLIAGLVAASCCGSAAGQDGAITEPAERGPAAVAETENPALAVLVEQLASDDFATRETASQRLATLESITLDEIHQRLIRGGLTPEQRTRLDAAARRRFGAMPRAGLGVQFGAPRREEGVQIGAVLENFPAAEFLRADDVVLAIEGVPVRNTAQMGAFILSHQPGETLRMLVEREIVHDEDIAREGEGDGEIVADPRPAVPGEPPRIERLTLDVPLGKYADLNSQASLTPDRIEAAYLRYQYRSGLLAEDAQTPIVGGGVTPLGWLRAEGYDHTQSVVPGGSFENISAWRHVRFAGQPESWVADIDLRRGDANAMARRVIRGLQADGIYDQIEEALAGYRAMLDRVVEIDTIMEADGSRRLPDPARLARMKSERAELVEGLEELAAEMEAPVEAPTSEADIDPTP
jgi:hypothetical protein